MATTKTALPIPRPSRRKFDHDKAFEYWLNPGGQRRSYHAVAREFGVSEPSVLRAASVEDWPGRAWEIEEAARQDAARRAVKTVAERIEEDLRLIDAGKLAVARRLQAGLVDADLGDLVALIKTEMLLTGGASERLGVESEAHRRSVAEIEAELAALPADAVDAMLTADAIVVERVAGLERAPEPDPIPSPEPTGDSGDEADANCETVVSAPDAPSEGLDEASRTPGDARAAERRRQRAALEADVLSGRRKGRW